MRRIEENNRVGKTRDLFKKIRDTKGTFHAKMGTIKQRCREPKIQILVKSSIEKQVDP